MKSLQVGKSLLVGLAILVGIASPVAAAENGTLPLPRFVSLRSEEVNVRAGPGVRYPLDWIYNRRDMPVEVVAEFETWRKIRDWQGTEGWVHQSMLSGRRTVVVLGQLQKLRREADADARPVAMLEPGVLAKLKKCPRDRAWCEVEVDGAEGWLKRDEFWGVYPNESID